MDPVIAILVVFLILFLIYWGVSQFIKGVPLTVIGIILGILFLVYALKRLGVGTNLNL